MTTATERFLRYITVETTSDEFTGTRPSTPGQIVLADQLVQEMEALGLEDIRVFPADHTVFGTLPANTDKKVPTLGFVSHMDTAPDASGRNVNARIVKNYDGGEILLGGDVKMSPETGFPCLQEVVGEDLIVTDGTTLLGADDKAGIAEILTMVEKLKISQQPHGTVKVAFTTDEELGSSVDLFDVKAFGCDFAYTVDGGPLGELEYECFNGAAAVVTFQGTGVHPGAAKNVMKNASSIATEFHSLLPAEQTPEHTQDYEGFIHLTDMQGTVTEAQLRYILRDHDYALLNEKKELLRAAGDFIARKYGPEVVSLQITDSYRNMKEMILPHMHLIETAEKAFRDQNVTPRTQPIRGGTDGAMLSYNGLPCPNLSTGGYQFHSIYEFIPVRSLETMPDVLCGIVYEYAKGEG
ncbi:MAG: peptidase T [Oscillospiraceae bacterium]|nr:peptidase T [Oscillospiraceae bacterium]